MHGHKSQLLVDMYFGTQSFDMNASTSTKFVQQLCKRIRWGYKTVQQVKRTEGISKNYKAKCTQLRVAIWFLKRMAFKGSYKILDHWEKTLYQFEGQPYAGLPVFRIVPTERESKVKVVHQNLLLPFDNNVEDSENEESQQDVDGPPDCIQAVSDDVKAETKVVLTDPETKGKGDEVCIQSVQPVYEPNF